MSQMSKCNTNIWQLATNIVVANASDPQIKSLFRIVFLMVRKNWVHNHSFEDVVELVTEYGGQEHLKMLHIFRLNTSQR